MSSNSHPAGEPPNKGRRANKRKRQRNADSSDSESAPRTRKVQNIRETAEGRIIGYLYCLGLHPMYTSADIASLLEYLSIEGMLVEPLKVEEVKDRRGPGASRVADILGKIRVPYAYLGAEVKPSLADTATTVRQCEKCRGLRLSYIFGQEATVDDMEHFRSYPHAVFNLAHVDRNFERCEVCRFLRECLSIERSNGNPCKPKAIPLRASEFCGIKNRRDFEDVPCLVFASKKADRQGCILPAASLNRVATVTGRQIEPDSIDYNVITRWLSFCQLRHSGQCQAPVTERAYKLKVIDCHARTIGPLPDEGAEYLALSYVWGPSPEGPSQDGSRLPKVLPKVIEDAVVVTLKLGFRFLWVDRYCIPQDDPEEKLRQLKNMGHIYAQSVLAIIAAAGDGPEVGLPGVTSTPRARQPSLTWGKEQLVYCVTKAAKREIQTSKWSTRGWTYQEGLLARRRLVFTKRQVYFQCQAMHQTESVATQLDNLQARNVFALSIDFGVAFPVYQELQRGTESLQNRVHEFTRRQFTFDSDALDAFRGILALFAELPKPVYHFAGLPLFSRQCFDGPAGGETAIGTLARGLTWRFTSPMIRRPGFPSWTWVGWKPSSVETVPPAGSPASCFHIMATPESRLFRPKEANPPEAMNPDPTCFSATVELKSGERCGWDEGTMDRLRNDGQPTHLLLTGWIFDVKVKWTPAPEPGTFERDTLGYKTARWNFTEPKAMGEEAYRREHNMLLSGLDDAAAGMDRSGQTLHALVLMREGYTASSIDSYRPLKDPRCTRMLLLLMRSVPGGATFERVDCTLVDCLGHFAVDGATTATMGDTRLEYKQIRLC